MLLQLGLDLPSIHRPFRSWTGLARNIRPARYVGLRAGRLNRHSPYSRQIVSDAYGIGLAIALLPGSGSGNVRYHQEPGALCCLALAR